jgi:hypothetical protein
MHAKMIMTLVFKKNANFLPKIGKNRQNGDHNIDPSFNAGYFALALTLSNSLHGSLTLSHYLCLSLSGYL